VWLSPLECVKSSFSFPGPLRVYSRAVNDQPGESDERKPLTVILRKKPNSGQLGVYNSRGLMFLGKKNLVITL